jgi:hypothetical protein
MDLLHTLNNKRQESPKSTDGKGSQYIEDHSNRFLPIRGYVSDISHADHAGLSDGISIFINFEVFHYVDVYSLESVFAFSLGED